jgi:hypothetical protein
MTSTIGDSITNSFGKDGRVMWSAEHSDPDYGTLPFEYLFDSPTKASEMLGVNPGEVVRVVILPYDKYAALAAAETRAGEAEKLLDRISDMIPVAGVDKPMSVEEQVAAVVSDLAAAKAEGEELDAVNAKLNAAMDQARAKCRQFWNEKNVGDAEMHAVLQYIHDSLTVVIPPKALQPGEGEKKENGNG